MQKENEIVEKLKEYSISDKSWIGYRGNNIVFAPTDSTEIKIIFF